MKTINHDIDIPDQFVLPLLLTSKSYLRWAVQGSAPPLAAEATSLIEKETVSIYGAVELVEIPNNKSQMTNKYQWPKSQITNQSFDHAQDGELVEPYMILKREHIV